MKKILLSFFFILCASVSYAYDVEVDGIYYNLIAKTKTAEVTYKGISYDEYESYSGSVTIPSKITVSETEYSVTSIEDYAFFSCSKLSYITIPNSVTRIGDWAFSSCSRLTSVTIPNSVTSIGYFTFSGCSALTSVTISNSVTNIGWSAFENCSALTTVTIPNSVKSIEGGAFDGCSKLTSVTIPNSVTSIGDYAFRSCYGLTSVTIPNSVTSIGDCAFLGCSSLTSVTIPNSVTSIGNNAFEGCSNLISVTFPNSIKSIGDETFSGCFCLTSATIPNSVVSIGDMAFYNCSALTSVTIPSSVKSIGNNAFKGCSSLASVIIPESVTSIGGFAFSSCSSLTSVTIGSSVQSISSYSFSSCKNLETVTCLATTVPKTPADVFEDSYVDYATLIVPETSLQAYKTTAPWSEFGTFKTVEGTTLEKKDVAINDNCSTYSHEEEECKSISYSRDFSNTSWQSLYVPFAMNYDDWKDDFEVAYINDVRQYDDNEDGIADRTEVEVFKMKEGKSIEPNTPYLIKTKTTGEKTITLEDATLYQTEENSYDVTSWFTRFNFIGTYHTISNMASNGYYAMSDGTLKKATSNAATLQPFRWYLSVTDRNGNPVSLNSKSMSIVFDDGETTSIENVNNEKSNSSIHTLTGLSKGNDTKTLAPGIYIKNGKKFIVK